MKKIRTPQAVILGQQDDIVNGVVTEALLRPEPKDEDSREEQGGLALLGLTLAAFALIAIYVSTPVDSPEWPDCPIQTLGSCGEQ